MERKRSRIHIGLRTVKTVIAVIVSMIVVESYGATTSKLIFAMLGAMAAVQPTFKESLESCLTQILGVFFGGIAGVLLMLLPVHPLVATGIGMVLVITFYNAFRIRFSPSLPCFIVVMVCTTPDVQPMAYAFGRIWDSAIGLGIGMLINSLIFPYDNSRQIRSTVESLDRELILFLEEMFDGDDVLPDADAMTGKIDDMARQLKVFANQKLILNLRRQREELEVFKRCEGKARQLVAQMEVLSRIGLPGRLSEKNRSRLTDCGANIRDERSLDQSLYPVSEVDVVTNYHVGQILTLRQELLEALRGRHSEEKTEEVYEENAEKINEENVEKINEKNVEKINEENVEKINEENAEKINEKNAEKINEENAEKINEKNAESICEKKG